MPRAIRRALAVLLPAIAAAFATEVVGQAVKPADWPTDLRDQARSGGAACAGGAHYSADNRRGIRPGCQPRRPDGLL